MNTIFICDCQYENLGDLIINKLLVDEFAKYGTVYIDTYNVPENFKAPLLEGQNLIDLYSNYRITLKNKYKLQN